MGGLEMAETAFLEKMVSLIALNKVNNYRGVPII
jgi:hypothetical protein